MSKIAFIFPGQGSQAIGMGKDLYENYEAAKAVFDKADEVLGKSVTKICFEGPDEDLKQTINTQPAILTTSIAALEALKSQLNIKPDYVAGHSLGEYGALYEAGVLSIEDTLKLIAKRAELMSKAKGGSMAAVLGLEDEKVKEITDKIKLGNYGIVVENGEGQDMIDEFAHPPYVDVANYNCPGQVVITGEEEGIKKASELLTAAGAKRVMPLAVSGAFHSQKMKSAGEEFEKFVAEFELSDANVPVVTNVDATATTNASDFKGKMPKQIYSSVYWTQTIQKMVAEGVDTFIEIGPGKVLAGLNKKISAEVKTYNVFDKASLELCVSEVKK